MSFNIALAGKGGTGKTTVSGLFLDYLARTGKGPILAVDADANSNLNEVLGVAKPVTLGEIREEIARSEIDTEGVSSRIPSGMSKQEYADFRFADAVTEEENYDLLVMGRSEGKGCYCFINNVLQEQLRKHCLQYNYLIVDNEAGLEHISRGVLPPVNLLLLVSDCSRRGIQAAGKIAAIVGELGMNVQKTGLLVNRAPPAFFDSASTKGDISCLAVGGNISDSIREEIAIQKLELLGVIPNDNLVYEYDAQGIPLVKLPSESPARTALENIVLSLNL